MDYILYKAINGIADHYFILDKVMIFIAQYFQYFFAVILLVLWFKKDIKEKMVANRKAGIFAMVTMLTALVLNHVISFIYFRQRPYIIHPSHLLIPRSSDPSFPSDHAAFAFALAFSVLAVNKAFGRVMIVMAVLLSFARVYVGIHYPFDVIGGALIAYFSFRTTRIYSRYVDVFSNGIIRIWDTSISKAFKILGKNNVQQ